MSKLSAIRLRFPSFLPSPYPGFLPEPIPESLSATPTRAADIGPTTLIERQSHMPICKS